VSAANHQIKSAFPALAKALWKRSLQILIAGLFANSLAAIPAVADYSSTVASSSTSGIGISVSTPFDNTPSIGVMPINVEIANLTLSDHSWEMATGIRSWGTGKSYDRSDTFFVPSGQTRKFHVYVDILNQDPNPYSYNGTTSISVSFTGYGLASNSFTFPNTGSAYDKLRLPQTAFSPAIETSGSDLESFISGLTIGSLPAVDATANSSVSSMKGYELHPHRFTLQQLPDKWQGLLSLNQVWITSAELETLAAPKLEALLNWTFQGGHLNLVVDQIKDPVVAMLQIEPGAEGTRFDYGLGRVSLIRSTDRKIDGAAFTSELAQTGSVNTLPLIAGERTAVSRTWALADGIGELSTAAGMVILIMVGYGIFVGPINMLVFARTKRHRLFITTPIIATVASALLVIFILLSDGTGGAGNRLIAVLINPISKTELLVQEQVSRAGLLINRDFTLGEETVLLPIKFDLNTTTNPSSTYYYNSDKTSLARDGQTYGGDWFENRAFNAHVLGTVTSTRSSIELLGGPTPRILSSFKIPLSRFFYRDRRGEVWKAERVNPGSEIELARATEKELTELLRDCSDKGSKAINSLIDDVKSRRGYFYAWSADAQAIAIQTVNAIDWKKTSALITGVISEDR
jgi:hypothetical protein